jgi:hypothetical protein
VYAAQPVAIVEDINAPSTRLEVMDFLSQGQTIKLGKSEKIVLGYMNTCFRETITGGTVKIMEMQSEIHGGQLIREEVECSGAQTDLDGQVASKSGAMAFRGAGGNSVGLAEPDIILMGTSPVFIFEKPARNTITITRMDKKGEVHKLTANAKYLDTSKKQMRLHRGGLYKAELSETVFKVFKIDSKASHQPVAVISRMVRLP